MVDVRSETAFRPMRFVCARSFTSWNTQSITLLRRHRNDCPSPYLPVQGAATGPTRVYTDLSGPTDRVILETERSSFDHPRALTAAIHGHPDAPAVFRQLAEHIIGVDVEFLQLEHTL